MKQELRLKVHNKYNAHCAYCGKEITYKEMQVDHIHPLKRKGEDTFENMNPSCRRCNHYKRAHTLEIFRDMLQTIQKRLMKIYIFKVAIDYGIIKITPFDGVFYFEKQSKQIIGCNTFVYMQHCDSYPHNCKDCSESIKIEP